MHSLTNVPTAASGLEVKTVIDGQEIKIVCAERNADPNHWSVMTSVHVGDHMLQKPDALREGMYPLTTSMVEPCYGFNPFLSFPAWERLEGAVRVQDSIRKPVVFIGKQGERGFIAHGTGFIAASFIDDYGYQQVVTAKHVIDRIQSDEIDLRLNTHGGEARNLKTKKEWWLPHPDKRVDVSVLPFILSREVFDFLNLPLDGPTILTEQVIAARDIGVGDDVVVTGMYVARLGETKNIPIVRTGTIAAMAEEKIRTEYGYHHAYLIEARSIDGLSGSPVFVHLQPWRIQNGQVKLLDGHYEYFMGMLLGHAAVENPSDSIEILQPEARDDKGPKARVSLNTGVAVVLPISYVVEAVNQPKLIELRAAARTTPSDRRFVADSAAPPKPSVSPENPTHREDFERLLQKAATTPPSDNE